MRQNNKEVRKSKSKVKKMKKSVKLDNKGKNNYK
jgi:hypothetical protein